MYVCWWGGGAGVLVEAQLLGVKEKPTLVTFWAGDLPANKGHR